MKTLSLIFLCLALPLAALAQKDDPTVVMPDLNELEDWHMAPSSPALLKSVTDFAEYVLRWKAPGSVQDWQVRRPQVERAVRHSLGLETFPERTPLNVRITSTQDRGDYTVDNLVFESRPGFPVTANLYRLKKLPAARVPGILCPIGHILREGKRNLEVQSRSIKLARMGFVVLAYDAIGHGERNISGNTHKEGGFALLPLGETISGWMVWDSIRGIDYLQSREDVDPARIGVTGNSGGGLNTLYTAAIDPRVMAATVVGYTFQFNNWVKYAGAHGACSYLPGLREVEWFEIAGLIAPRALLMLNGEYDPIFPINGARAASNSVIALYSLLGVRDRARFYAVPKQGHAYSRPYREQMYGWMAKHLQGQGDGSAIDEGELNPFDINDKRLFGDPDNKIRSTDVVSFARAKGLEMVAKMPDRRSESERSGLRAWVQDLAAPPDAEPHNLLPETIEKSKNGGPEKIFFISEVGEYVPGLLWKPSGHPKRTMVIVDEAGKAAAAKSGLVDPLVKAGNAVLAIDTRGRGETMGVIGGHDTNYHLLSVQIMADRPLAGRRAFDLTRAVDFVARRDDLTLEDLTVVSRGDDGLVALLAAISDPRIKRVASGGYFHSFVSQMVSMKVSSLDELVNEWNQGAMRHGRFQGADYTVDLGAVIPGALLHGDVPDLVSLLSDRKVLICDLKDRTVTDLNPVRERFARVTRGGNVVYDPARPLSADWLVEWLAN